MLHALVLLPGPASTTEMFVCCRPTTDPQETLVFIDLGTTDIANTDQLKSVMANQIDQGKIGEVQIKTTGPNWWRVISGNGNHDLPFYIQLLFF